MVRYKQRAAQNATDLLASVTRCAVLVTAAAMTATRRVPAAGWSLDLMLAATALYVLISGWLAHPRRLPESEEAQARAQTILISLDVLLITGLLWVSGGLSSDLYLLYYLPILLASLRLNMRGAISSSILAAVLYLFVGLASAPEGRVIKAVPQIVTFAGSLIILAVFFAAAAGTIRRQRQLTRQLEEALERLTAVYKVARAANASDGLNTLIEVLLAQATKLAKADAGFVALINEDRLRVEASKVADKQTADFSFDARTGQRCLETGAPIFQGDEMRSDGQPAPPPDERGTCQHDPNQDAKSPLDPLRANNAVTIPLQPAGRCLGVLQIWCSGLRSFDPREIDLLIALCDEASVALENAQLQSRLEHMAVTDPLTGLSNMRGLEVRVGREIARARRDSTPLAVMVLNVDGTKQVNDILGHAAGDRLLEWAGQVISRCTRSEDFVARYAGDEFVVMLSTPDPQVYLKVANRMQEVFLSRPLEWELPEGYPGLSAGVAVFRHQLPADCYQLLDQADRILAQAKQAGPNQVRLWQESPPFSDKLSSEPAKPRHWK